MQFFIMSIVLFLVFVLYFRYLFKLCFSFDKKIILLLACLCSIPCLKPNSILFIFEVHFILISFLMTKIMKYIIKKQDKIKLRLLFIIIIPIFISGSILTYGYMNIKDIRKTEYTIYTDKKLNKDNDDNYIVFKKISGKSKELINADDYGVFYLDEGNFKNKDLSVVIIFSNDNDKYAFSIDLTTRQVGDYYG